MNLGLGPLFQRLATDAPSLSVLATVSETIGSSYRKPGAMMLLCERRPPVGLVSGGCLEGDLAEHARAVVRDGVAKTVTYDLRRDDALWGLGIGCGGTIRVFLERISSDDGYGGLTEIERHWRAGRFCWLVKRMHASAVGGYAVLDEGEPSPAGFGDLDLRTASRSVATPLDGEVLLIPIHPPPRLLICGAGPDALPLAQFAISSGWRVDVVDHRPAHTRPNAFPDGVTVTCAAAAELATLEACGKAQAAVVMSHHLKNDALYVRALAASDAMYIGILGPAMRRDEVLSQAGVAADARIRGPAGLDIGADLPESIALSVLAEACAALNDRSGGPIGGFRRSVDSPGRAGVS